MCLIIVKRNMHTKMGTGGSGDDKRPPHDFFKNWEHENSKKKRKKKIKTKSVDSNSKKTSNLLDKLDNVLVNLNIDNKNFDISLEKTQILEETTLNNEINAINQGNENTDNLIQEATTLTENVSQVINTHLNTQMNVINNNVNEIQHQMELLKDGLANYRDDVKTLIEASNSNIFTKFYTIINSFLENTQYLLIGGGVLLIIGGIAAYYFSKRHNSTSLLLTEQSNAITQALLVQSQTVSNSMHLMNQHQQPVNITIQQPPQVENRRFWRSLGNLILQILEEWLEGMKERRQHGRKDFK